MTDTTGFIRAKARIYAERERQIDEEGWTPKHDDEFYDGELIVAARAYFEHGTRGHQTKYSPPLSWPWANSWWKPKGPVRDLERAGALGLAEAERLERQAQQARDWVQEVVAPHLEQALDEDAGDD